MKLSHLKYILLYGFAMIIFSCAQINPLQGGEKDTYAPKIDSAGTYPLSGQTNFNGDEVVVKFQEYITLNKPTDNIIITPQLNTIPEITSKNKTLKIGFKDSLLSNTTYTISFNRAVKDFTEKNDSIFQFVFSTGDYIDSLSLQGKIADGFTNQPNEGYLIGLYAVDTSVEFDSIPYLNRPIYIAQSDRSGAFKMNYLKEGEYYIFGIEDQNKNLKLDPLERRAFLLERSVKVGLKAESIELASFGPREGKAKLLTTKFDHPGKLEFIFNTDPTDFSIETTIDLLQEDTGVSDSLVFWLAENPTPKMRFYATLNGELDTLKPLFKSPRLGGKKKGLAFSNNLVEGKLLPDDMLELLCTEPIDTFDLDRIHFLDKDSTELESVGFEIENVRTIVFDSIASDLKYVQIDSAGITSKYGNQNKVGHWVVIDPLTKDYFGSLIVNVDSAFGEYVLVELLNSKNEVVRQRAFSQKMNFIELLPGDYQVRLIIDENKDGKWTTGSLKEMKLPERVLYNKELIKVKSRWEKEVDWIIEKD